MKTLKILIFCSVCIVPIFYTQASSSNQSTSVPTDSRFELIQSELAAKITLKVDKHSGAAYQLLQDEKGIAWQIIKSEKHPNDTIKAGKVNYQVFTSGLAVSMTYLINLNTGATWQLSIDPEVGIFWAVIE